MSESNSPQALVIFEDRTESFWLSWLKPGFRHCHCLIRAERGWILIDPLLRDLRVTWLDLPDRFDPIDHYIKQGRIVLSGHAGNFSHKSSSIRPITCVEIVKRTLGLSWPSAWTPYQLYCALLSLGWQFHQPIDDSPL